MKASSGSGEWPRVRGVCDMRRRLAKLLSGCHGRIGLAVRRLAKSGLEVDKGRGARSAIEASQHILLQTLTQTKLLSYSSRLMIRYSGHLTIRYSSRLTIRYSGHLT